MKTSALSLLLCAVMVLTGATETRDLVKRRSSCPNGWQLIHGRCFCFVSAKTSWCKAESKCQAMGGHLASVHNAVQFHRIQEMILKATGGFPRAWLGGAYCREGQWLWSDGSSFDYTHCGKVNNHFWGQRCLQMNYGKDKCWGGVDCFTSLPSVCVRKH